MSVRYGEDSATYSFPEALADTLIMADEDLQKKIYDSKEVLLQSYWELWNEQILPNIQKGLSAAIYTQTSDIEEEINGLMTYDHKVTKFSIEGIRTLN